MIQSLLKAGKFVYVKGAVGAGDTAITNGAIVDLTGCDSVIGIAILGTVVTSSKPTLKAYTGNDSALSDGAYEGVTAGATAGVSDSNKLLVLDVVKPGKRYVRFDMTRADANTTVEAIIAIPYNYTIKPTTQPADVLAGAVSIN